MIRLLRTMFFSILVVGALGYVTSLFYYSSGQLEKRTSRALEKYLTVRPVVFGARQSWLEPLSVERVEIPASPVIDHRDFLLLYNIDLARGGEETWSTPEKGLFIRIRRGRLFLDRELVPGSEGSLASVPMWNYQDLFFRGQLFHKAARQFLRAGHQVSLDTLEVELQEIRRRQEKAYWKATMEDITLEGSPEGVLDVRGDLPASPYWSEGRFHAAFRPQPRKGQMVLEVQGSLDNLKGLDDWLSLLAPEHRRLVSMLKPTGPVTFTLAFLRFYSAGLIPGSLDRKKLDYLATIQHYDSMFRLTPWDLEIRHVNGSVNLTPPGISFGPRGEDQNSRLSGEIWGTEVELRGSIHSSGSEFRILLPETDLRGTAVSAQPQWLGRIWKRLRPAGTLSGEFTARFDAESRPLWNVVLGFQELSLEDLPILGASSGKISLREEEGGKGSGVLQITTGSFKPMGELQGEVPIQWSGKAITIRPAGLKMGEGSLSGQVSFQPDKGIIGGSLSFDHSNLNYSEGLFTASRSGGKIEFTPRGEDFHGQGRIELRNISLSLKRLPRNEVLCGEKMEFTHGELQFDLAGDAVRPLELDLRGKQCSLRLCGTIGYRGELKAVAIIAIGEPSQKLNLMAPGSLPTQWLGAVGDGSILLGLSGSALNPRIRIVKWSHPDFQRKPAEIGPAPR